ncbi:MAG: Hpt domain-containing protein, partial [Thauera sp.]
MTHATEPDLGALTWVKGEIDAALERARSALDRGEAGAEASGLQFAQTHLHQVRGALAIVGLDGLTRFADATEHLLAAMAREAVPSTATQRTLARRALAMIGNYLDEIAHGAPNQPLRLADTYLELAAASAQADASPADLFHPDLSRRPPPPASEAGTAEDIDKAQRSARSRFERGLLEWLRKGSAGDGARMMREAIAEIDRLQPNAAARSLWWTSLAFYDALIDGSLQPLPPVKRLCTQIDAQFRRLLSGAANAPERLQRELLYQIAHCPARTAHQQAVRALYQLDALLPAADATVSGTPTAPLLETLNRQLAAARAHWDAFCTGTAVELQRFEEALVAMGPPATALGRAQAQALIDALQAFAHWLRKDPLQCPEAAAMEVATALLTLEGALGPRPPEADFSARVQTLARRLEALMRGEALGRAQDEASLGIGSQAQEKSAVEQLVREMRSSLAQVEQVLDDFFRDQTRRDPLTRLHEPLQHIIGALSVLGETGALELVRKAAVSIARFADPDSKAGQPDFEALADQLSALGFYLDALPHGGASLDALLAQHLGQGRDAAHARDQDSAPEASVPAAASAAPAPDALSTAAPLEVGDDVTEKAAEEAAEDVYDEAPALAPPLEAFDLPAPEVSATELNATELNASADLPPTAAPRTPEATAPLAAASSAAAAPPIEADLLEIFIEEAQEVLATQREQLELLRTTPTDPQALLTLRRGFHTLKGSGRMVGLSGLGEVAWAVEQALNRWLQLEWAVTPALLHFIDDAHGLFAQWVAQLRGGDMRDVDARNLSAEAERLRNADAPPFAPAEDDIETDIAADIATAAETTSEADVTSGA